MSSIGSLPEGYEYCGCHPETCSHFDGMVYVGKRDGFQFNKKEARKIRSNRSYVGADVAKEILDNYGIECAIKGNPKKPTDEIKLVNRFYPDGTTGSELDIPHIKYKTYSCNYFTNYHRRYSLIGIFEYVLKNQSTKRKAKWDEFIKAL
jgi:hypothetical protein